VNPDNDAPHNVVSYNATAQPAAALSDPVLNSPNFNRGETWSYTFDTVGEYPYFCSLHPEMIGKITVVASFSAPIYWNIMTVGGDADLTVIEGSTVIWENSDTDDMPHDVKSFDETTQMASVSPILNSGLFNPGQTWSYTFDTVGEYPYYCSKHPAMRGTITVVADPGRKRARRAPIAHTCNIETRVFNYFDSLSGVFEGADGGPAICARNAMDGAWAGWSGEIDQLLKDTKYFGYSCKKCAKQISVAHNRWDYIDGLGYVHKEFPDDGKIDGAWAQWTDSAGYDKWSNVLFPDVELDPACVADLNVTLTEQLADTAWGAWHSGNWTEWTDVENISVKYDWALTPSITKIQPAAWSGAMSTKITMTGDFSSFVRGNTNVAGAGANTAACTAGARFVSPSGLYRECKGLVVEDQQATCWALRGKPFPIGEQPKMFPRLQLCTQSGQEVVAHPEPNCCNEAPQGGDPNPNPGRVDIALRIHSTAPSSGSIAGGTLLTIKGAGFSKATDKIVRSALTYNYYDRMTVVNISTDMRVFECEVVTASYAQVVCRTPRLHGNFDRVSLSSAALTFDGEVIYNGEDGGRRGPGRNARIGVSVNDVTVTGCGSDDDAWSPPAATEPSAVGCDATSCDGQSPDGCWCDGGCENFGDCCYNYRAVCLLPSAPSLSDYGPTCEVASSDGGIDVWDYRFQYGRELTPADFEAGVLVNIKADHSAHIALSATNATMTKATSRMSHMYEIVVGGWRNTQSSIRRYKFGANMVTAPTPYILAEHSYRTIWIKVENGTTESTIVVGQGCNIGDATDEFMRWTDPKPLTGLAYLGVTTVDVSGKFVQCTNATDMAMGGGCDTQWTPFTTAAPAATTIQTITRTFVDSPGSFKCEFDYTEVATPVITALSPRVAAGATRLTIRGARFNAVDSPTDTVPTVHVGYDQCTGVTLANISNATVSVETGSQYEQGFRASDGSSGIELWELECDIPAMAAGQYNVRVGVPGRGFAAHPTDHDDHFLFVSELALTSVSPAQASWAGGTVVTLSGAGFSSVRLNNTVYFREPESNVLRVAHVLDADHTMLRVVAPAFEDENANGGTFNKIGADADVDQLAVEVMVAVNADQTPHHAREHYGQTSASALRYTYNGDPAALVASELDRIEALPLADFVNDTNTSDPNATMFFGWERLDVTVFSSDNCSSPSACNFQYTESKTPELASIVPTSNGGLAGIELTLTGVDLNASHTGLTEYEVMIGGASCTVDVSTVTSTELKCTLGETPAGTYDVYFRSSATGTARNTGEVTFTSEISITSVSALTGSFGGGQVVTISGTGFGTEYPEEEVVTRRRRHTDVYGGPDEADEAARDSERHRRDGAWGGWIIYPDEQTDVTLTWGQR
jgi:plastocyanin